MAERFIVVDPSDVTPPYQQIYEQIDALIQRGELKPSTPLPTVRQLAGDLKVAPNTVARAYADLQAEGRIVSDGRRGTRVAERTGGFDRVARKRTLEKAVRTFVRSLILRGYTRGEIAGALLPLPDTKVS